MSKNNRREEDTENGEIACPLSYLEREINSNANDLLASENAFENHGCLLWPQFLKNMKAGTPCIPFFATVGRATTTNTPCSARAKFALPRSRSRTRTRADARSKAVLDTGAAVHSFCAYVCSVFAFGRCLWKTPVARRGAHLICNSK